jgi:hypothetical protein
MIIGITGLLIDNDGNKRTAGAGKDTVANILLVRRHVVTIAFADAFKRIVKDVYGFSYEQLWGPSQLREIPDKRHLRMAKGELGTMGNEPNPSEDVYLTPRYALLQFGSTAGRSCCKNTWTDYGIRVAQQLMNDQSGKVYIDHLGVIDSDFIPASVITEDDLVELEDEVAAYPEDVEHVAFSDLRFYNEAESIKANGGKIVRVKRNFPGVFNDEFDNKHESETQVASFGDDEFDYVLENNSSLDVLQLNTLRMFDVLTDRIMPFDEAQADVPPFMRKTP